MNQLAKSVPLYIGEGPYYLKPVFEYTLLLLLLGPMLFISIIITLLLIIPTRGKIIFCQKRIGKNGKKFTLYKFRTLKNELSLNISKDNVQIEHSTVPFGIFLRRTGLDEVPQFFNVIKRDMNIVGPRAFMAKDLICLSRYELMTRHQIRPGITGQWQLTRNYDDSDMNYIDTDLRYVYEASLLSDIKILIGTIAYVWKKRGI